MLQRFMPMLIYAAKKLGSPSSLMLFDTSISIGDFMSESSGSGGGVGSGVGVEAPGAAGVNSAPDATSPAQDAGKSTDASTVKTGSFDLVDAKGNVVGEFGKDGKPTAPKVMVTEEKEKEPKPIFDESMPEYEPFPEWEEQMKRLRETTGVINAQYDSPPQGSRAQELDPFADAPANRKSVPSTQNTFDKGALDRVAAARANDRAAAEKTLGLNSIERDTEKEREQFSADTRSDEVAVMQQQKSAENAPRQPQQIKTDNKVESDEIFTAEESDKQKAVPPEVEQKYLRVGDKFYNAKNTSMLAFEDKGNKLETASNSESIAESMVRIAQARGWDEIKVSGSEIFRREAWLEAASRGMSVKGYLPSEQDKAELAKRAPENKIEKVNETFRAREKEASLPHTKSDSSTDRIPVSGQLAGVLLEHGKARFNFDKDENQSYFVKFQGDNGKEKIVWGIDLARAVEASEAKVGQRIELENQGRKTVTVDAPVRDADGKVTGFEKKETHRNIWEVKADAFRTQDPKEVLQKHPELASTYAALRAVDKRAEADGLNEQQRAIVAARVRQNAINSIERGNIPAVNIKDQMGIHAERNPEREQSR